MHRIQPSRARRSARVQRTIHQRIRPATKRNLRVPVHRRRAFARARQLRRSRRLHAARRQRLDDFFEVFHAPHASQHHRQLRACAVRNLLRCRVGSRSIPSRLPSRQSLGKPSTSVGHMPEIQPHRSRPRRRRIRGKKVFQRRKIVRIRTSEKRIQRHSDHRTIRSRACANGYQRFRKRCTLTQFILSRSRRNRRAHHAHRRRSDNTRRRSQRRDGSEKWKDKSEEFHKVKS